jgi:hypothetical protein
MACLFVAQLLFCASVTRIFDFDLKKAETHKTIITVTKNDFGRLLSWKKGML